MAAYSLRIDDFGLTPGGLAIYTTAGVGTLPDASGDAKIFPSKAVFREWVEELDGQSMEYLLLRMIARAYQLKTGDNNFNSPNNLKGKTFTLDLSVSTMATYG